MGKEASLALLSRVESQLAPLEGLHLVGDSMTIADIIFAIVISRGLEWVLDQEWQETHPAIMKRFRMVQAWEPVREVIKDFHVCRVETPNIDPRHLRDAMS